jgi:hypothetical protein
MSFGTLVGAAARIEVAAAAPRDGIEDVLHHDPNGVTPLAEGRSKHAAGGQIDLGGARVRAERSFDDAVQSAGDSTIAQDASDSDGTQGVRIAHVIRHKPRGKALAFNYSLDLPDGARLVPTSTAGYAITDPRAPGLVVGGIAPPWARDANGHALPASYKVNGSLLTLNVDVTTAAFPVVADPYFWWGAANCGWVTCSVYLSRSMSYVDSNTLAGLSLYYTLLCGTIGFFGGWIGALVGLACAVYGWWVVAVLNSASNNNACLKITGVPYPTSITYISTNQGSYCID